MGVPKRVPVNQLNCRSLIQKAQGRQVAAGSLNLSACLVCPTLAFCVYKYIEQHRLVLPYLWGTARCTEPLLCQTSVVIHFTSARLKYKAIRAACLLGVTRVYESKKNFSSVSLYIYIF